MGFYILYFPSSQISRVYDGDGKIYDMCWLIASCYTTSDIESNEIHTPMDAHINPETIIVVMLCTSE